MIDHIAAVRALCSPFPGSSERLSYGEPAWFVARTRRFVTYAGIRHNPRPSLWCAAPPGVTSELTAEDPVQFFRPPYVGHRGWLGVHLDGTVDWGEVGEIIDQAYRSIAPKGLLAVLDGRETAVQGNRYPVARE